jgi:hypothetical protein
LSAGGVLVSIADVSLIIGLIYVVCIVCIGFDFLYARAYQLRCDESRCEVRCLLHNYTIQTQSITEVSKHRNYWPSSMLFGMRPYQVRYCDPTGRPRKFAVMAWTDPAVGPGLSHDQAVREDGQATQTNVIGTP